MNKLQRKVVGGTIEAKREVIAKNIYHEQVSAVTKSSVCTKLKKKSQ